MTDERQGEALWTALERLPWGSGIVFRHHATPMPARRALYEKVRTIARARRITLVLAGSPAQAIAWRADGAHGPANFRHAARSLLKTASAHTAREVIAGRDSGLLFVSPVFATRSHPDAAVLGPRGFAALAGLALCPVAALGGINASRARRIGASYWAAIDAWSG
jgi:thiamine-phosphate pyrophosphorylase